MTTATATPSLELLDAPYDVTPDHIRRFREEGFIKLKDVLSPEVLAHFSELITDKVMENAPKTKLEDRDTYGKAFIQVGNIWEKSQAVKPLTFSRRLAKIATELMGCRGVKLWHDQALYKEAGGGFTPWHVDQQYWPIDSGNTITAWIPLQKTPIDMGPLQFGKGSHLKNIGRDLAIGEESEKQIRDAIKQNGLIESYEPYDAGEVSFHYGWTLHRAGPNTTTEPRKVHTVIYIDKDARLIEPKNDFHRADWKAWTPNTKVGETLNDPKNPMLYDADA